MITFRDRLKGVCPARIARYKILGSNIHLFYVKCAMNIRQHKTELFYLVKYYNE